MSDTRISEKALRAFMERAYEKEGFEAEEARQIADVLMQADLFGIESHGAQRMMYYHQNIKSGSVDVRARAEVLRETPVSALMDGHFAMGHLTAAKAMRMAIKKAKTAGIGMVAVRNSSHYGIAGYYPLMAEREGLAAFSMTNTGPIMVPTFGREMMLGTNPMAFCMPADPYPFWFDASTTVVTLGKVEVYNKRGKPMPEGWAIDGAGQPCSDAHRMNESILSFGLGGILPLGGEGERTSGHKGYGLAIMVEALTGVLAQGMLSPEMCGAHGDHTSHFFMAFDPAMFGDPAAIRARMEECAKARREKQPLTLPSAGSTFKRPEGHFAAKLIDDCGLRGLTVGGAQVTEKHAGFIVNIGGATARDMLELMRQVEQRVFEQTGVQLEPEVRILGED